MILTDNTILLTGGSSGIGKELLVKFLALGNTVIVVCRDVSKLAELKTFYQSQLFLFSYDLTNIEQLNEIVDFCKSKNLKVNVLVNNAGVEYNYLLKEVLDFNDRFEIEMNVNLLTPIKLIKIFLPILAQNSNAAIINVTSALIYTPKFDAAIYNTSKSGLSAFTRTLRMQLLNTHIKVFEVVPPLTDTPLTRDNINKKVSVDFVVQQILKGLKNDKYCIHIGMTFWIYLCSRISPYLLNNLMMNRYLKKLDGK